MESVLPAKKVQSATARKFSALLICVPLAVIACSFAEAPYLATVGDLRADELPAAPNEPVLLYRNQRTRFYYTASDLLRPQIFGKPRQYIDAVVYDVWPTTEAPTAAHGQRLTWYLRIWKALRGRDDPEPTDLLAAEAFRNAFGQDLRIDRGAAKLFEVASGSSYRRDSGISHFAALGIRIPEERAVARSATPQQFPQAIKAVFEALGRAGVNGVGVPGMIVRRTLGEEGSRDYSWSIILDETGPAAPSSGIARVLYGGWGVAPEQRASNDAAFRTAWATHLGELKKRVGELAHEQIRLSALLGFAALLIWRLRGTELTWQRALALPLLGGGFVYTIAQAGAWAAKNLGLDVASAFALEAVAALLVGALIESVVRFDPKKILAGKEA